MSDITDILRQGLKERNMTSVIDTPDYILIRDTPEFQAYYANYKKDGFEFLVIERLMSDRVTPPALFIYLDDENDVGLHHSSVQFAPKRDTPKREFSQFVDFYHTAERITPFFWDYERVVNFYLNLVEFSERMFTPTD